ncbi:uncharacterized protein [Diabrotica undecimpunctata]|uniref:uncharacterized protein isoform X1 n=1 Tax=Diabrotica undecimpunctata TaxID=50387 RepID=UPI003B641677
MYFNIKTGILVLFVVVEFSSGLPYNNKKSTDEESAVLEDSRLLTRLRRNPDNDPQSEAIIEPRFGRGWKNNHHGYNHGVGRWNRGPTRGFHYWNIGHNWGQNHPHFGYGPPGYHPQHQPWNPHGNPHYGSYPHDCSHNNGRPNPTKTPHETSSENPGVSSSTESGSTIPQIDIRVGN